MEERFRLNEEFDNFSDFLDFHYPFGKVPKGWTKPPHNQYGFPLPEINQDNAINILTLGDSCTEGEHYEAQQKYPGVAANLLSDHYGCKVGNWNFGLGGGSYDFITRTLMCGLDHLRPDVVIITFPTVTRRELFKKNGRRIRLDMSTVISVGMGLVNPIEESRYYYNLWPAIDSHFDDTVNVIKNFKVIEWALNSRNVIWGYAVVGYSEVQEAVETCRDSNWMSGEKYMGFDFDVLDQVSETDVHPGLESHKSYGERIANWLIDNHGSQLEVLVQESE